MVIKHCWCLIYPRVTCQQVAFVLMDKIIKYNLLWLKIKDSYDSIEREFNKYGDEILHSLHDFAPP